MSSREKIKIKVLKRKFCRLVPDAKKTKIRKRPDSKMESTLNVLHTCIRFKKSRFKKPRFENEDSKRRFEKSQIRKIESTLNVLHTLQLKVGLNRSAKTRALFLFVLEKMVKGIYLPCPTPNVKSYSVKQFNQHMYFNEHCDVYQNRSCKQTTINNGKHKENTLKTTYKSNLDNFCVENQKINITHFSKYFLTCTILIFF